MPTVAPPASATATLTAALSAGTGTGTPTATDALAGLFQSVLAQVVSQTTATAGQPRTALTDALAQATNADGTATTDLLAGLLALTEGEGEEGDDPAVNADLLSQLLAALGGNAQTLAQLQQVSQTAETPAGIDAALLVTATASGSDAATATLAPAVRQFLDRTGFTGQVPQPTSATEQPAATPTPPAAEPAAPVAGQTATTEPTAVVPVPQTVTVADAARIAGRVPPVVVPPSLVPDRGQQLPPAAALEPAAVQPPVAEIQAIKAAPAVVPGQPLAVAQQPDIDLPIPGTAVQAPSAAGKPAFTLPPGVTLTVTKTAPPVQPTAAPVAPANPTTTAPIPITPAAPGITAAVAQPVPTTATADPFVALSGFAQLVSARTVVDDRPDPVTDPAAVAGLTIQRGEPAATPAADRPAAAPQPAPVSDQLTGPILAHVQARADAGETELRVRLDPPELGTVKVKIVSTGTDVRAELQVTTEAVRRVVESQLPELRQKLDDAGVRVQRMDVTTDSGGANAGTGRDDRGGRWQQESGAADPRPLPTARPPRQPVTAVPRNRIDVTA